MPPTILVPRYRRRDRLYKAVLELRPAALWVPSGVATMVDIAGRRLDATNTGSPVLVSAPDPLVRGLAFSGSGQYATSPTSVPTPSTSVSAMVGIATSDASASQRLILGRGAVNQHSWNIRLGSTALPVFFASQSNGSTHGSVAATGSVNDGLPHVLAGSFDGTTLRVGRDDQASATSTSLSGSWHKPSTAAVQIAATSAANLFPGTVHFAGYWVDRVLADAERHYVDAIAKGG